MFPLNKQTRDLFDKLSTFHTGQGGVNTFDLLLDMYRTNLYYKFTFPVNFNIDFILVDMKATDEVDWDRTSIGGHVFANTKKFLVSYPEYTFNAISILSDSFDRERVCKETKQVLATVHSLRTWRIKPTPVLYDYIHDTCKGYNFRMGGMELLNFLKQYERHPIMSIYCLDEKQKKIFIEKGKRVKFSDANQRFYNQIVDPRDVLDIDTDDERQ